MKRKNPHIETLEDAYVDDGTKLKAVQKLQKEYLILKKKTLLIALISLLVATMVTVPSVYVGLNYQTWQENKEIKLDELGILSIDDVIFSDYSTLYDELTVEFVATYARCNIYQIIIFNIDSNMTVLNNSVDLTVDMYLNTPFLVTNTTVLDYVIITAFYNTYKNVTLTAYLIA